jgi:hypothetical protein
VERIWVVRVAAAARATGSSASAWKVPMLPTGARSRGNSWRAPNRVTEVSIWEISMRRRAESIAIEAGAVGGQGSIGDDAGGGSRSGRGENLAGGGFEVEDIDGVFRLGYGSGADWA